MQMKCTLHKKCIDIQLLKRTLLIIVIFAVFMDKFAAAKGNDSIAIKKEVTILSGLCTLSSIDELYSFQKYSGSNAFIGLSVGFKSPENQHYLNMFFSSFDRTPRIPASLAYMDEERFKEINTKVAEFNYNYLHRIYSQYFNFFVSANWINSLNYTIGDKPEMVFSSLAPGVVINYTKGKNSLDFQLNLPIVSLTLRNAYHISQVQTNEKYNFLKYVKDNIRVQSLGELRIVYAKLAYRYSISRKFDLDAQYILRYISDNVPRSLKSASGLYCLGLTSNF
jgi:hypothetical protein